jgi:hypothetical protein
VDEPDVHPPGDQGRLPVGDRAQEREIFVRDVGQLRVVSGDGVVGQRAERVLVAEGGRVLERSDADVAGRDAGAVPRPSSRPSRYTGSPVVTTARLRVVGTAERVHRLADDVLAEHRPEGGAAVAAAGEPRPPAALQLDIDQPAVGRAVLTEQDRAAVAEHGEPAVLVPGVGLRDRPGRPAVVPARRTPRRRLRATAREGPAPARSRDRGSE